MHPKVTTYDDLSEVTKFLSDNSYVGGWLHFCLSSSFPQNYSVTQVSSSTIFSQLIQLPTWRSKNSVYSILLELQQSLPLLFRRQLNPHFSRSSPGSIWRPFQHICLSIFPIYTHTTYQNSDIFPQSQDSLSVVSFSRLSQRKLEFPSEDGIKSRVLSSDISFPLGTSVYPSPTTKQSTK
jgi:hypothetical protein